MKKILHLIIMTFMSMTLCAQNIGDTKDVNFEDYNLRFTVKSLYPAECSVICTHCAANSVEIIIPSFVKISEKKFQVVSVDECAFMGEVGLTSVEIPKSVTKIANNAFRDCSNLTNISMPNTIESIGSWAFMNCSSLKSISIPEKVKYIKNATFYGCLSLETIDFHDNLKSIEYYAFAKCCSLKTIVIPASVVDIDGGIFSYSNELKSIVVEDENPVYDSRNDCNAIIETATNKLVQACKNTIIPNDVVSVGTEAFEGILTDVELPNSVVEIGYQAFCASGLTKIFIPNSVKYIASEAFLSCDDLESISVESGNSVYDSRNDCNAIVKTSNNQLVVGCKNTVIPTDVTIIGDFAFKNCVGLTNIEIPENVTYIGDYAFQNCVNLETIEIPSSVVTIGFYAFYNCSSFASIKCWAETLPYATSSAFYGCPEDMVIFVPGKSLKLYNEHYPWKNYVIKSMTLSSPLDIYPNPVNDKLFIKAEMNIEEIFVFDALGRLQVAEIPSRQGNLSIDLSGLNRGVYFLKVKSENGEFVTERFIKK